MIVAIVCCLCGIGIINQSLATIPPLHWPLPGEIGNRTISLPFGSNWPWGECPPGIDKRHVGIDLSAVVGESVFAAEDGVVQAIIYDPPWEYGVTIEHSGFTTVCWHVNPVVSLGQAVSEGQLIATIANLGSNTHFHFGVRDASYSNISNRGALPTTDCDGDPAFPEFFVNAATLDYGQTGTPQTSWLFNTVGDLEDWDPVNMESVVVQNGRLICNPGNDPQLRSPLLDRLPSSINYLKTGMRNYGGDTDGDIFFNSPEYEYSELRKAVFENSSNDLENWITVRLDNIDGWNSASNIDHIRVDPVGDGVPIGGSDDVVIDFIFLRKDETDPAPPTISSVSPSSWTHDDFSVSFEGNDPPDVNPIGPDVYGSGILYFRYRVESGSYITKYPDYFDDRSGLASATVTVSATNQGINTFYVYSRDKIGRNGAEATASLYYDSENPTTPTNVTATPPSNTINSFEFSWDASSDGYSGIAGYYWKINTGGESFTSSTSLPVGAYATHQDLNIFYVRAVDNAENYSTYGSVEFVWNTGGCGPPLTTCGLDAHGEFNIPHSALQRFSSSQDPESALLIRLEQQSVLDWIAYGQPNADYINPGIFYRIGFWYRTTASTKFGWALGRSEPMIKWHATKVHNPIPDGNWHQFWSAPFSVSKIQLQEYPSLFLYSDERDAGQLEISDVELFVSH